MANQTPKQQAKSSGTVDTKKDEEILKRDAKFSRLYNGMEDGIKKYTKLLKSMPNDSTLLFNGSDVKYKIYRLKNIWYVLDRQPTDGNMFWMGYSVYTKKAIYNLVTELVEATL